MSNDQIREIFFKWADERGVDKASHEEWNKFLSVWNLRGNGLLTHQKNRWTIPAPATCKTCGTRHTAPTTGVVHNQCALCGGELTTESEAADKLKMRICWDRGMFWHTDCEKHHSAIMKELATSKIECLVCGMVGAYPVGGSGEICCDVLP
ncbi:MAG: hypothetical protein WC736_14750 [Gallionella sp.]|jgi:ribosomal protein S27E